MATGQASGRWFVRVGGKIRGPFTISILTSMKHRGRLDAGAELSEDRLNWFAASHMSELFCENGESTPAAPAQQALLMSPGPLETPLVANVQAPLPESGLDSVAGNPQCFYSLDGIVHGPIPLSGLQARAHCGQLAPVDYVWIDGSPDWTQAALVPQLVFPTRQATTVSVVRSNVVMISAIAAIALLLLGIPAWYVLGLANQREDEQTAAETARRDAHEKREQQLKEELARLREDEQLLKQSSELAEERKKELVISLAAVEKEYDKWLRQERKDEEVLRQMERANELRARQIAAINSQNAILAENQQKQDAANSKIQDAMNELNAKTPWPGW